MVLSDAYKGRRQSDRGGADITTLDGAVALLAGLFEALEIFGMMVR